MIYMERKNIGIIKQKSLSGIVALTSRTFLLQIIAFSATFLLTIFLSPSVFGIFYVVSAIISFLAYFSDIGLAAALIQKKEEVTRDDLATTFTIQQMLVVIITCIALIFSSRIGQFYSLDTSGIFLMRALILSFFLSSLKTIPAIILERKLAFKLLVIPQILETVVFYVIAVILAWKGFGITSFTYAVVARGIVGLVSMYLVSPWKISLGIQKDSAKKLLQFGIPFQLNSFLALIKDDLLTVFLGKLLPFSHVGYIGWSKKWAEAPLRLIMDSIVKVTFPAYSRLQKSLTLIKSVLEMTIFGLSSLIFPITAVLIFSIKPLIYIIPKYQKWEPAIYSFYLFSITSAVASITTPLTNALNAMGRIRTTLFLMVLWTVSAWILTVLFVSLYGFNGVAISLLVISSSIFLVVFLVKKVVQFSFFGSIRYPLFASIAQGIWYFSIGQNASSPSNLVIVAFSGVILYIVILWLCEKQRLKFLIKEFIALIPCRH